MAGVIGSVIDKSLNKQLKGNLELKVHCFLKEFRKRDSIICKGVCEAIIPIVKAKHMQVYSDGVKKKERERERDKNVLCY